MNATVQSLIQSVLALLGGYLIIRGFDPTSVSTVSGIVMGLVSVIWGGIAAKAVNGNAVITIVTNIATFVGGILVANGKLSTANAQTYIGLIVALAGSILGALHISTAAATAAINAAKNTPKNGQVTKN
jgi:hypothetical protein